MKSPDDLVLGVGINTGREKRDLDWVKIDVQSSKIHPSIVNLVVTNFLSEVGFVELNDMSIIVKQV